MALLFCILCFVFASLYTSTYTGQCNMIVIKASIKVKFYIRSYISLACPLLSWILFIHVQHKIYKCVCHILILHQLIY